ncbi:glycosyltransferase [Comamonas sp. MYb21]|uniref:glycosyltransferase n=1 Tax=Comamonas sp. MYb21 TaxID=1848648 RepID=UPI0030B1F31A
MTLRVMWMLNHTLAREFEIPMLKRYGVSQFYLPKIVPNEISFQSNSVSYEEDIGLEIPPAELEVLNSCDWYSGATPEAWAIANRYFNVVFCIFHDGVLLKEIAKYFKGLVVCRAYGLKNSHTYSEIICKYKLEPHIRKIYSRFYFSESFPRLIDIEERYLSNRRLNMPLGVMTQAADKWQGSEERIYFICPQIETSDYYKNVFENFKEGFSDFDFVVGGEQLIPVNDSRVLVEVTEKDRHFHINQNRVMFYHSQEPNHIHHHPFEAVLAGMPLVFMAGGMLDRLGGRDLPGRATSLKEARRIIRRLMKGDKGLAETIRNSQQVLLKSVDAELLSSTWKAGVQQLEGDLQILSQIESKRPSRPKRIAVILPEAYRGGTLRGALMLAQAIHIGSRQCGEAVEVVFAYREDSNLYGEDDFVDLGKDIALRPFRWHQLSSKEACRAMHFAGHEGWFSASSHVVPDDGMRQFMDCDLWLVVSDRVGAPLLPLRPVVAMIYDYLQRYEDVIARSADLQFIQTARSADRVLVTTQFTKNDALQYAGVDPRRLAQLPMLIPQFSKWQVSMNEVVEPYFIWTTNAAPHKNHIEVMRALRIYYEEYGGVLLCKVTGVGSDAIPEGKLPHLKPIIPLLRQSPLLSSRVRWLGDLPDHEYRAQLKSAAFLMHPARIDNGTISVIEAAQLGVPSLSTDYPAMREMNQWYSLNLQFMDGSSARNMAGMLMQMEKNCESLRSSLPKAEVFESNDISVHAQRYWQEVRKCL